MTTNPGDSQQIAQLAAQINKPALSFDPGQYRKGNVVGIDLGDGSTPPTITVLLSGDVTVPIVGVRLNADYSPQQGDMVMLAKQGAEMFALCAISAFGSAVANSTAGGWTKATLKAGKAHNGNGNGDLMYRRILEHGSWKMQWQGGITFDGDTTVLAANLDPEFRPTVRRSVLGVRENASGGGTAVSIDFNTTGLVGVAGENWATSAQGGEATSSASPGTSTTGGQATSTAAPFTDSVDPNDSTTTDSGHSHGVVGSHFHTVASHWHNNGDHSHTVNSHTHTNGSHVHTAVDPTWISFNGVEYFL